MSKKIKRVQPDNTKIYIVKHNETLMGLSIKFNTPASHLQQLNRLATNQVFPGMELFVPESVVIPESNENDNTNSVSALPESNFQNRRPSLKTLDLPQIPDLSNLPIPSNKSRFNKQNSSVLYSNENDKDQPFKNRVVSESHTIALEPQPTIIPVLSSERLNSLDKSSQEIPAWYHANEKYIKGSLRINQNEIVFTREKGKNLDTHEDQDTVKLNMSEIRTKTISIVEKIPHEEQETNEQIEQSLIVCIKIGIIREQSGGWTNVSITNYEFCLFQKNLKILMDSIADNCDPELIKESIPSSSSLSTTSASSFSYYIPQFKMPDITNYFWSPASLFQAKEELKDSKDENLEINPTSSEDRFQKKSKDTKEEKPLLLSNEGIIEFRIPKLDRASNIFKEDHLEILVSCLPNRFGVYDLALVYSTFAHGISLQTLYRKMEEHSGPSLILVEDMDGYVFGSFSSVYLRPETHFFGTGETFLFRLEPNAAIFPWSQINDYFISCGHDYIAFGGGNKGKFGLWLDDNLYNGSSFECETFQNIQLSKNADFKCKGIEIWGFVSSL